MTPHQQACEALVADMDNAEFWQEMRKLLGSTHEPSVNTLRALLTKERCAAPARVQAMTDQEIKWLCGKLRDARKIRVYRAAPLQQIVGFRWYTNMDHALHENVDRHGCLLAIGEIDPRRILFRYMGDGRKHVIALPESVRTLKVQRISFLPA